jgi:predicted GNAT family acetyltransferase
MDFREEANRIAVYDEGKEIGEMTWMLDANVMLISHTYVNPRYRGQKIAEQLVAHGVDKARREGKRIFPVCSYAVKEFQRKPEYSDVLRE